MDLITLSFQIAAFSALCSNLVYYFENYIPRIASRSLKFGRAAVGLESDVHLFEVPKRWFSHFYIFAFTFSTWTLYAYWNHTDFLQGFFGGLLGGQHCIPDSTAILTSVLMWIQVSRRLYECLFISKFSNVAKMNISMYAIGLWHYFGAIISIFGSSGSGSCAEFSLWRIAICVPIFIFAWVKQLEAHTILGNLREGPSDNEYKIPFGGLFEYVSCPNYFCEVIIYLVYSTLFGFQNVALNWVTIWVIFNQIYSANLSHNWYRTKFGKKYPKHRKALIPFVF